MNQSEVKLLLVDDQEYILDLLSQWLESAGYSCLRAANGKAAREILRKDLSIPLVISDIYMPGHSGIELLSWIREERPEAAVIMMTGMEDRQVAVECLKLGAFGYLTKPIDQDEIVISVAGALERRKMLLASNQYQESLEEEIRIRTADLRAREEELVLRLVCAAESRDKMTGEHIQRIGLYSEALALASGWTRVRAEEIRLAATMHDLGKIGVPDGILLKPGTLTPEEFEVIKLHTRMGAQILKGSRIPLLQRALEIATSHHEKWDGSGYMEGLAGEEIPESARIVTIVDAYDAMTEPRPYSSGKSEEEAAFILIQESGRQFDPELVSCFLGIQPEISRLRDAVKTEGLGVWSEPEDQEGPSAMSLAW